MADLIFVNGDIITVDDDNENADIVAVKDGVITYVGNESKLSDWKGSQTEIVDLKGATLIPGLIEAHTHPLSSATDYNTILDITGWDGGTAEEFIDKIKRRIEATPSGEWVKVSGYNPMLVPDLKPPTIRFMDSLCKDKPFYIQTQNRHCAYFNSKALQLAGITKDTVYTGPGEIVKDATGELTGLLTEEAAYIVYRKVPPLDMTEGRHYIRKQMADYAKYGFTTITALGVFPTFRNAYKLFEDEVRNLECPVRVAVFHRMAYMSRLTDIPDVDIPGKGNYSYRGVKFWADGSPYAGTMATEEPYLDTEMTRELGFPKAPHYGSLNHETENLYREMLPYHMKGLQIAVHVQGERAIDQTLGIYERLLDAYPRQDHRYRLEHCGLITKSQLDRAKLIGVTPSFFVDHIHYFGHSLKHDIIGPERAARFMPVADAHNIGHIWTLHSDSPCCPPGPFRVMKTAVTREMNFSTEEDRVLGPEQRVKIKDVIRAFTVNAAWQIHHEHILGKLKKGFIADFAILSANPMKVNPREIIDINCLATYKNGLYVSKTESSAL